MSAESNMRIMLVCLLVVIAIAARNAFSLPIINTCQANPSFTLVNNTVNVSCNIIENDQTLDTYWIALNGTSDGSMRLGNPVSFLSFCNFANGTVDDVRFLDGAISYNQRTSGGAPNILILSNYTGVFNSSTLHFTFYWYWENSSLVYNSQLAMSLWNYSSSGWVEIPCQGATSVCQFFLPPRFGFTNGFAWNNITVYNASDFVNPDGVVQLEIWSNVAGNDWLIIDYLHLVESKNNGNFTIKWYANNTGNFSVMGFVNDTMSGQSNSSAGYVIVSMSPTTTSTSTTSTTTTSTTTTSTTPAVPVQISGCQVTPAIAVLGGSINVSASIVEHATPLDQFWFTLNGSFVGEQTAVNGTNVFEYPLMLLGTGIYHVICFVNDTASLQNNTAGENVSFQIVTTTTATTTSTTVTSTTIVVAVLANTTVSPSVFLNDYVSGYTRLINTNDASLPSQDCQVFATLNDTDALVKVWDTSCKQGTQYLDLNNDFQYLSENCTLSDSQGYYYFTGKVTEADGFETGRYYKLVFSCNMKSAYGVFYVDVQKPMDVGKWFEFARRYLGLIVLYVVVLLMLLVLVGLIWKVIGRNIAIIAGIIIIILLLWLH
jgi:hypothetical protein